MHRVATILAAAAALPSVFAWGAQGHQTVGYVAMEFLTNKTLTFVQSSLGTTYNKSLGIAATWADDIKSDSATWGWASELHYVDALDEPLDGVCNVEQLRDCQGPCILSAMANYTSRLADTNLSGTERQIALKFLDHFFGDLAQPLHVENYAVGGNNVNVKCNGATVNLHKLWDTSLVVQNLINYNNSVTSYVKSLVARVKSNSFTTPVSEWTTCSNVTKPYTELLLSNIAYGSEVKRDLYPFLNRRQSASAVTPLACPLVWAREANKLDCSAVFTYTTGQDLCTSSYYTKAAPIIDLQLARAGVRLATWLNAIFDP